MHSPCTGRAQDMYCPGDRSSAAQLQTSRPADLRTLIQTSSRQPMEPVSTVVRLCKLHVEGDATYTGSVSPLCRFDCGGSASFLFGTRFEPF